MGKAETEEARILKRKVAKLLKELRVGRGLTQREVAAEIETHERQIGRMEKTGDAGDSLVRYLQVMRFYGLERDALLAAIGLIPEESVPPTPEPKALGEIARDLPPPRAETHPKPWSGHERRSQPGGRRLGDE